MVEPCEKYLLELKTLDQDINNNYLKYIKEGNLPENSKGTRLKIYNFTHKWRYNKTESADLYKIILKS